MRGKRAKQYKKLMNAYAHTFGFRAPYQVLMDSQIVLDATKHKMELVRGLEKCLHGMVKPMITQCSIRHLYTLLTVPSKSSTTTTITSSSSSDPPNLTQTQKDAAITLAKTFERRRCGHHTLSEPLSNFDCIQSCIVSPSGENKHHYIVATQSRDLRAYLRSIPGVPLVYINRSVMIMEPMADVSWERREKEEWEKFTIGIKDKEGEVGKVGGEGEAEGSGLEAAPAMRRRKGPRGPNPLSVKKKK
ncbi:Fcf1-domain-containing protein, partial [Terfezia claveryi]